jgi:hypothetical protein
MSEKTYKGHTQAEWLAWHGKGGKLGCPSEQEIHEADLYFAEQEKLARQEIEERRFQTQLDETRQQGSRTRLIAWLALLVSAGSVVVAICALSSRSAPSAPQTTNAVPSTSAKP